MKPAWISFINQKRGFTLLELLLSVVLLTFLISSYTAIQNNVTLELVSNSKDGEQKLQIVTALESIKDISNRAYAVEIKAETLQYSEQVVFYLKEEMNITKIYRFYLERYSGVLYESIQATSSPGVLQLAVEIGDLDFLWHEQPNGPLLEVIIQGKSSPHQKIQRFFYLRNCQRKG